MKKKVLKIITRLLLFLLLFFSGVYFAFNSNYVQNILTEKLSDYLSDLWGTEVSIKRIYLKPFKVIEIENLYIEDQHNDTLVYLERLYTDFSRLQILKRKFIFETVSIDGLKLYLKRYKGEENLNLDFILESFRDSLAEPSEKDINISLDELELNNVRFIYNDQNQLDTTYGIHYQDLKVTEIYALFNDIKIINDSIIFSANNLSCNEKSGLKITNLQSRGYVSGTGLDLYPLFIRINNSTIDANRLAFKYKQWSDYKEFNTKVRMFGDFNVAHVKMLDIAYFAGELHDWKQEIILKGILKGTVNNLSGKSISLQTADKTFFRGDFNLDGLPDFTNTFITIKVKKMGTSGADLENIQVYPFVDNKYLSIPDGVKAMGNIKFSGEFTGFVNDFVAFGTFVTDIGSVISDLSLKTLRNDTLFLEGNFISKNLHLDILLENDLLGILNSKLSIKQKTHNNKLVVSELNGTIDNIGFKGYNYRNVILNGVFKPDFFNGYANINDPALGLEFDGQIEIKNDFKTLNFSAELLYADLGEINFLPIEKYSSLSGRINFNASGYEYSSLIGKVEINQLNFCTDDLDYEFGDIFIENDTLGVLTLANLSSPELDISISGDYDIITVVKDIEWQINKRMPALFESDTSYFPTQYFDYEISIKDIGFLSELGIFDFDISNGGNIKGTFNPGNDVSNLQFYADSLRISDLKFIYPEVYLDINDRDIFAEVITDGLSLYTNEIALNNSELLISAKEDSVEIAIDWRENDKKNGSAAIGIKVNSMSEYLIDFKQLGFIFLEKNWNLSENSQVMIDSNQIGFSGFKLSSEDENIRFNGTISEEKNDSLNFEMNNFNLDIFNRFLYSYDFEISGISNGNFGWIEQNDTLKLESDLKIDSVVINDYYFGDISAYGKKSDNDKAYDIRIKLINESLDRLMIEGQLYTDRKRKEKIKLAVNFSNFDLGFLNSLNIKGISKVAGIADGLVNISGDYKNPVIEGKLAIDKGGITVDMIGSHMTFSNQIDFKKDYIGVDPFYLKDDEGHKALAYGTILHDHFKDWNFNLDIEIDDFKALDLKQNIESLYYGQAYATGNFNISGYDDKLFITIDAKTEPNTNVSIPIGGSNTVEKQDFVNFITYDENQKIKEIIKEKASKGVDMSLNIDVTPDAELALVFDEATGDILKVKANGLISLGLDQEGEFTMKGALETVSGEYMFSLQSIINKKFTIQPNSKIIWYGNPYDANIDIETIYKTRAALYPIMTINPESYKNRVNVNIIMHLTGKLMNPVISFKIELPDSEERERSQLTTATTTTEDLNKQVVSLLLFGSFQSLSGGSSTNFAAANGYEMLSNQVSNMLSRISETVDVEFNYRPDDAASGTGQEIGVGFSTQLLHDRLTISTTFGVRDQSYITNENVNNIVGDFSAEYKIKPNGNLRLKVYNKSNDYQTSFYKISPYTQGVGVVFRKDFEDFTKGKKTDPEKLQKKFDKMAVKEIEKDLKLERKQDEKREKQQKKKKSNGGK